MLAQPDMILAVVGMLWLLFLLSCDICCWLPAACLQGICAAIQEVLTLNQTEVAGMGKLARQLFEADRKHFEQQLQELQLRLQEMIASAVAAAEHV